MRGVIQSNIFVSHTHDPHTIEAEGYGATEDYFYVVIIGLNTFKK